MRCSLAEVDMVACAPRSGMKRCGAQNARRRTGDIRTDSTGMALIQVIVAMAMIMLCGVAGVRALVEMNRKAAAMRTLNNARAVVQRNIDTALGVPFSRSSTPEVLATTSAAGVVYDEDGN